MTPTDKVFADLKCKGVWGAVNREHKCCCELRTLRLNEDCFCDKCKLVKIKEKERKNA
jgi:hypothetical protein